MKEKILVMRGKHIEGALKILLQAGKKNTN